MNRQEILNYLLEKRRLTAPVSQAATDLEQARANVNLWADRQSKIMTVLACFIILALIGMFQEPNIFLPFNVDYNGKMTISSTGWALIFGGLMFVAYRYFPGKQLEEAKEMRAEAQRVYNDVTSSQEYVNGQKNFPAQFYNYHDCYRLYNLIEECRADDLKEAFNLLESQQYNEAMLSKQDEIVALQQDIAAAAREAANNSRVTAVASVATAFNTGRTNKILKDVKNK